jgi:pyruvate-ferredoxin/flavodoxin oxidoreductase
LPWKLSFRFAGHNTRSCCTRPHQGAGGHWRTALYTDVVTAVSEAFDRVAGHGSGSQSSFLARPRIIGGRYGLSSKEFTPAMAKAVFDELKKENHSTISRSESKTTSPSPALNTIRVFARKICRARGRSFMV